MAYPHSQMPVHPLIVIRHSHILKGNNRTVARFSHPNEAASVSPLPPSSVLPPNHIHRLLRLLQLESRQFIRLLLASTHFPFCKSSISGKCCLDNRYRRLVMSGISSICLLPDGVAECFAAAMMQFSTSDWRLLMYTILWNGILW